MYSPAYSIQLKTGRRRRPQRLAPCSSSIVLPLLPSWFERAAAFVVTGTALVAIGAAVLGA